MPHKTKITYQALLKEIQAALDENKPECEDIYVDVITLHKKRIDGANWSVNVLRHSGTEKELAGCEARIAGHIKELRVRFDVGVDDNTPS